MKDEKVQAQFKKAVKYKEIGFFIILFSVLPMAVLENNREIEHDIIEINQL